MRPLCLLALVGVLALAGCSTASAPAPAPEESYVSGPEVEVDTASLTPNPVDADTTVIVKAVATAPDGAVLDLEMHVHASTPWDDIPNQTLPAALIEDCGGTLTDALFAAEAWSFTRGSVTAIPRDGSEWTGAAIDVLPSASAVYAAGRGVVTGGSCTTPKTIVGAGKGGIAIGIAEDAATGSAWAAQRWGFDTAASGVVLSDCTIEVLALGAPVAAGFVPSTSATSCSTGAAVETRRY